MRTLSLLAAAAGLAAALPAQWALLTPTTFPSQRRSGACAFDAANNRLIFYGGVSPTPSTILSQTWAFTGTWSLLSPPGGALGRWGHQMVRAQNNRIVTFGGRSPTLSGFANDTVEWTGSAWQNVPTPAAPSPRYVYGMSYDSVRNVVVLFGGRNANTTFADTWEYDGVTWAQRTLAANPPARSEMFMAYDASLGATVLFGGYDADTDTVLGDTWHYDGTAWNDRTATLASAPSARYRGASAYDSVRQRIVLYGGFDGTTIRTDTFEYTGDTWNTVSTGTTVPPASTETLHGYDPVRRKFVVFGGYGGTFSSQTWEYSGVNTGFFNTFGNGCPTALGEATLTTTTPRLGQPWVQTIGNLPNDLEFVLVALGFSNTTWNSIPLPFDLGVIGLQGCDLLVSADLIDLVDTLATPGTATHTTPIPTTAALANTSVFVQGVFFDVQGGSFVYTGTTKGGRGVIGQ